MKVIRPVIMTDAILTASSVPENDYPVWVAGASYAKGVRVIKTHRIYESAIADNIGHNPTLTTEGAWVDTGPTNRWAMFDQAGGPQTSDDDDIIVQLTPPSPVSSIALLDVAASSARVQVIGGSAAYDQTVAPPDANITFLGLPAGGMIVVTLIAPVAGLARIGKLVIGDAVDLGQTEDKPTVSITDYSRRETDDFGVTKVVERSWARKVSARSRLPSNDVDAVQRTLALARSVPCCWIGDEGFEALTLFGFYKDFSIDLQVGTTSYCTLTIEGLPNADVPAALSDPAVQGVSSLRVVPPVNLTDMMLAAHSVPEDDYPAWDAARIYEAGDRVIWPTTHRVYESLKPSNLGNTPTDGAAWLDAGPTNRWAMFDAALGTATEAIGSITITITPDADVTSLAVLDVDATTVRVQAGSYDQTRAILGGMALFLDLEVAAWVDIIVEIKASTTGNPVSVGTLLWGAQVPLGVTETSPTISLTDYSRRETDDFGNTIAVERAWAKNMAVKALVRTDAVDQLLRAFASVRARPSLWIGDDGFDSLTIYGFFKDFSAELSATISNCSMSIEGLSKATKIVDDDTSITLVIAYQNAETRPDTPAFGGGRTPPSWTAVPIDRGEDEYRWATQAEFRGSEQRTEWSTPVAIAGISWSDVIDDDPANPKPNGLQALIADVQTTVDAKRTIFVQPDAPSAAESAENDWWQQTTADRSTVIATYRRVAGSGQLAIGGNRITIGGNPISLCWTPVEDQRIAAALTAAISAADLADSKVGVFTLYSASDPVPDGTGVGDFLIWSYLYPVVISYWSGAAWVDAATYGATAEQAIAIDAMADDDILARGEKSEAIRSYQALIDDWSALDAQAASISSASSARAAAAAAKSALDSYLGGLTPAWNDVATDTPISGSAFRTAFGGLATANVALRNAISVGAPSGTNVGSTPATTVESGAQAGGNAANSDGSIKDGKVDTGSMVTDAVTNISTFSSVLDQNSYQVLDYPIAGSGLARSRDLPQEFAIVKSRSDSVLDVYVEFDLKSDNDIIIRTACGLRGLISKASPGVTAVISDGGRMTYLSESRSFIFEGLAAGTYTIYGSAAIYMGLAGYPTGDGSQYAKISFIRVVEYKR